MSGFQRNLSSGKVSWFAKIGLEMYRRHGFVPFRLFSIALTDLVIVRQVNESYHACLGE